MCSGRLILAGWAGLSGSAGAGSPGAGARGWLWGGAASQLYYDL